MINARGGSKGVPRKNIRILGKKPSLLGLLILQSKCHNSHAALFQLKMKKLRKLQMLLGSSPFMRPTELADHAIQLDTIIYNAKKMEKALGHVIDAVALLQPTHPFRTANDVSGCIELLFNTNADSVITIAPNKHHPLGLWQRGEKV